MNLESELKDVLRRVDPPDGFADRVMRRASGQPRWPVLHRGLAASLLIALAIGGWGVRETLHARSELLTAMRIASQKVAHAQQAVTRR